MTAVQPPTLTAPAAGSCPDCWTPLRRDGSCGPCALMRDPLYAEMSDAQTRLDTMSAADGYTAQDRAADEATVARYWRMQAVKERDARTPINGCAQCGLLEAEHRNTRTHGWDAPTDRLRMARLMARRELTVRRP